MSYAKTDERGRIEYWYEDECEPGLTEFSNGEYVNAMCVDGLEDFVIRDGVAYFEPTPEKIERYEEAQRRTEHQEIMDSLPDALADLSVMVSDNTIDTADLQDALAELSEIVSELLERG